MNNICHLRGRYEIEGYPVKTKVGYIQNIIISASYTNNEGKLRQHFWKCGIARNSVGQLQLINNRFAGKQVEVKVYVNGWRKSIDGRRFEHTIGLSVLEIEEGGQS